MTKLFGGNPANDLARMPAVAVTMFGKHPGWGDHISNVGDEGNVLLFVRDLMYGEGLNRQIGSAAWEKLPPERRLAGFDHYFIWHLGGRMVSGMLWSSSDSRGRTQYPAVLAVETHRRHDSDLLARILDQLLLARRRCAEATEQSGVTRAVAELRTTLQRICPPQPIETLALPVSAGFQPGDDDLPRMLHELRGSCGHLSPSHWSATDGSNGAGSFRVRLSAPDHADLHDWIAVVGSQVHPGVSLLGFAERSQGLGDILAGTPTAQNFHCLRASPAALPFTTEIPFEIASGLREYSRSLLVTLKAGNRPARTVFGDPAGAPAGSWLNPLSLLKG